MPTQDLPAAEAAASPSAPLPTSFVGLGISEDLAERLGRDGITAPFPIQAMAIPDGLAGKNVCGKARTGSGKTLAFGLPVIERSEKAQPKRPVALILVPTRELAVQVAEVLGPLAQVRGLVADAFYGGVSIGRQIKALQQGVDIAIATPGRLLDLLERGSASLADTRIVVLDEADRMCDMGFMPQVERVFSHLRTREQTMLYSATLDGAVDMLIKIYLRDPVYHDVVQDDDTVEGMSHYFLTVKDRAKPAVIASIAKGAEKMLVFTRTKRGADRLVPELKRMDVKAVAIHGDRQQRMREQALEDFTRGKMPVLVATDVAARGLDIEGVDVVVHVEPPEDPKSYVHRSGRTARAGATGVVITLVAPEQQFDLWLLQRAINVQQKPVEVFPDDPRLRELAKGEISLS